MADPAALTAAPVARKSLFGLMRDDMVSYLGEYRCRRSSGNAKEALGEALAAIAAHPVVLFEKPGCGFCRRAKEMFAASYPDTPVHLVAGATPPYRTALGKALAVRDVTFPCIFIQGAFVGGADEVSLLHQAGELAGKLGGARVAFKVGQNDTKSSPSLCTQLAGGGIADSFCTSTSKWYLPQIKSYGNVVRGMSAVHVLLFIIVLTISESAVATASEALIVATFVIMAVFGVDLALYILLGATPLTIVGNLVTLAVWDFRGPAVPNIPYKAVFVFYVVGLLNMLTTCGPSVFAVGAGGASVVLGGGGGGGGTATGGLAAAGMLGNGTGNGTGGMGNGTAGGGNGTMPMTGGLGCWSNHSTANRATLVGAAVNSGALAIFRF